LLSLTRGRLAPSPVRGPAAKYYRKLAWASASFSILADLALALMGGTLKRKEKITGRFADIFSWMYLATATLHRFEAEGQLKEDAPFFRWAMDTSFFRMQSAFDELYFSLRLPIISWLFRGPVGMYSRMNRFSAGPTDRDGHEVASILQQPGPQRDRLTDGMYVATDVSRPTGRLERAMLASVETAPIHSILKKASRSGKLGKGSLSSQLTSAVDLGILTQDQASALAQAEKLRDDAIQVDSFSLAEYKKTSFIRESVGTF